MNTIQTRAIPILLAAALVVSCASDKGGGGNLVWQEGRGGPEAGEREEVETRPAPDEDSIVTIPEDVMKELMGFVNRPQFFVADRIEVEATRIPFQMAMIPLADPDFVETVNLTKPLSKVANFKLRSRVDRPLVDRDYARLRVGDGIDLAAGREIDVKTYMNKDAKRPAFLRVRALGHAVYSDRESGRRVERDAITLELHVVETAQGMEFRERLY